MNARSLSEDGAARYLESIDTSECHSKNVNTHLRSLVRTLSRRILCDEVVSLSQDDSAMQPNQGGIENNANDDSEQDVKKDAVITKTTADGDNDNEDEDQDEDQDEENPEMDIVADLDYDDDVDESELSGISKRSIARMEAFIKNCMLAYPDDPLPNSTLSSTLHAINYYPQFTRLELSVRLEIYFRSLKRVRDYNFNQYKEDNNNSSNIITNNNNKSFAFYQGNEKYECLIALEPQRVIQARAETLVQSFVRSASTVRSIRPLLTALVLNLSLEVLAVDVVGKEIKQKINRLVSEYEHQTSFASLAFLSSPEQAADTHLKSLVLAYLQYLQSTYKTHENFSAIESMLTDILPHDLRNTFHTVEFQSLGHLLQVCESYEQELRNIVLPPTTQPITMARCNNPKEVKQALKDLRREIITVNGAVIPPAHSLKELAMLLSETMNARTTSLYNESSDANGKNAPSTGGRKVMISSQVRIGSDTDDDDRGNGATSSGNEGDSEGLGRHRARSTRRSDRAPTRKRSFDVATVDKLTARLLIAASRSGTGADAYFVIQDLFGGDGVIVVPSRSQPKQNARSSRSSNRRPKSIGTIDITVRLSSVTIKVHANYDIYPDTGLDENCEPLIQLHSTTTETISLQEVRVKESTLVANRGRLDTMTIERKEATAATSALKNKDAPLDEKMEPTVLMLREKKTASTGKRNLSVRPAVYEKVEVWNLR